MIDPTDPAQTVRDVIANALIDVYPDDATYHREADAVLTALHAAGYTIVPTPPAGMVTVSRETLQALYEGRAAGTLVPFDVLDDVARALRAALAAAGFAITKRESASAGTGPDR